jgi:alanine dehydrogenase
MIVGVPAETKTDERRVAITPAGVREIVAAGGSIVVQSGAGLGSGISDEQYVAAGARMAGTIEDVYERAGLILHVKEPQAVDLELLRPHHVLFTYLHLAAYPKVAEALLAIGCTAIAYETVQAPDGSLPLLAPMSRIAGRMSVQAGSHFLEAPHGGKGVLMGGIPGVARARVTVLGAGVVGWHAIDVAVGMGARLVVLDVNLEKLGAVEAFWGGRVETLYSSRQTVEQYVTDADLVIGAVLVAGERAPIVVEEDLIARMEPGSVVVDVAIDQGGCIATSRETTHHQPTFEVHGVVHYSVGNMPGAVPHTSTYALTNATMRYVLALSGGLDRALSTFSELRSGVNLVGGNVTNAAVAHALGQRAKALDDVVG